MSETGSANGIGEAKNDLERVREEFEFFRAGSIVRRELPEELWSKAVGLLERYPINVVSRELRVNWQRLKSKRDGGAGQRAVSERAKRTSRGHVQGVLSDSVQTGVSRGTRAAGAFLQVSAGETAPANKLTGVGGEEKRPGLSDTLCNPRIGTDTGSVPRDGTCCITIDRVDGSRLTIRVAADLGSVESLCSRFLTEAR
jgi:hypothetical protein